MTQDQRRAVQSMLQRLGRHAKPQQIVEAMQQYGVDVSPRFVTQVKAQMLRDEAQMQREQAKRPPPAARRRRPQQRKIPGR